MKIKKPDTGSIWTDVLAVLILLILTAAVVFVCLWLGAWFWYFAWNAVAPPVFHGSRITYWQGFWIGAIVWAIGGAFKSTRGDKK